MNNSVFPFLLAPLFVGALVGIAPAQDAHDPQPGVRALSNRQLLDAPDEPRVGGQLQLVSTSGATGFSALTHTDVSAHISGSVARVEVEQQFSNPSKVPVEAIYTFPLPEHAAVDGMEFRIGARRVLGQIKEREAARKIYQAAKAAGKRSALLDQERANIFTQSVANIMPGDKITVRISFVQTLDYKNGAYEWAFPTVVGPRYTGASGLLDAAASRGNTGEVSDADKIKPPYALPGTRSGHDLSLHVTLDAGVPVGNIRSLLHPISINRESANGAQIELMDQATLPNRDFILRYQVAGEHLASGLLTQSDGHGGGYFALVMQPPAVPKRADISPRELVFVVDQTGSQQGFPIEKSKEAMHEALKHLRLNDTFQVLAFNTDVFPCFSGSVRPTSANLSKATKFINALNAGGGTDILKALAVALKAPADPKRLRVVVYLTDGFVGNDEQILDFERKNRGTTRVFPFGMGNSVNRALLEGMAREGNGSFETITMGLSRAEFERTLDQPVASDADRAQLKQNLKEQKSAVEAIQRFNSHIETPVLISPRVSFGALPIEAVSPDPIGDVFQTQPIIIVGRYTKAARGAITLSGFSGGRAWKRAIPVDLGAARQDNPALESLWARAQVDALERQNVDESKKEDITQLCLAHRLMSKYTSFVAVEDKVVNPGGKQATNDVPSEVPEGVDGPMAGASQTPRYGVSNAPGNGTFSAQPGDPLISIKAPADTLSVLAILPDGTPLPLQRSALTGKWEARFDIPTYAPDGPYAVQVVIARRGGTRQRLSLVYRVNTHAPTGKASVGAGGASVTLEAGEDVERVVALMPWGERLNLDKSGHIFSSPVRTPAAFAGKRAVVTLILTDHAHNRTEIALDWTEPRGAIN